MNSYQIRRIINYKCNNQVAHWTGAETWKKISMNDKYLILVSLPSVHNHAIETSLLNLPIDKSVQKEILRLVNNGFSNVKVVQSITIRNFIIKFTYEKHQSKIDQNALRIKIEQWKKSQPKDNFYFQSYSEVDGVITPLIFCQQTEWQKYLLDRYGSVCFIDATYKTTKYALPLFLLVVKTNVNYCVVASFFTQYKDSKSIEEALKVIKSWNDTWSPQYFVSDYCKAEYNAINKIFNCPCYIRFSRNIADSRDNAEFTEKVEKMKLTEAWLKNPKAQEYFIRTWLPLLRTMGQSQNKLLKNFDKSLSSIIEKYSRATLKIPLFLHGRPKTFVKHIYFRYAKAQNIYNEKKCLKIKLDKLLFEVKSEIARVLDFKKYHWPCKHICALFIYVPGCSFEDLLQTFQNNVFISPDPRYSITNNTDYEIQNNVKGLNENNENDITSVHPSSNINEHATSSVIQTPIAMKIFQIYQHNT
ncbi:zinc finger BED domain-containing protein 1-like [Aphis craccivora]|uniref:Zinc finger BED domain-containing protein 1-like n=1 Tax=Aphis craccivora TaxID=307492 RepID=A0A6G0VXT4_APHCR|nr:zinc finger BED domain-containing protein 1-like [Aphis craccivora]